METKEAIISNYNHSITLTERKNLLITGVKKIENFDKEEFLIETTMGFLVVKGDGLELIKLDTISGNVSIKGIINGFTYIDDNSKKKRMEVVSFKDYLNNEFKTTNNISCFFLFYGIFLSFLISLQYKFLFESKRIIRIIGNFVFSLDMALIYFIIMKRINYGEIHIIFYILIFLGYIFSYRKIQLFVSRILKRP